MRICLVNMPFGYLRIPSIAITQLKSIIDKQFGTEVITDLFYYNLELGQYLGVNNYNFIAENVSSQACNFGEWLFRQLAFPMLPDNSEAYLDHFNLNYEKLFADFSSETSNGQQTWPPVSPKLVLYAKALMEKRHGLGDFLDQLIIRDGLDKADIVGLTSSFQQNVPCFALARRIKEINHKVTIVMGGSNCESPMGEEIVQCIDAVDYTFSGNALYSFPEFIENRLRGRPRNCELINGVFSKNNVKNVVYPADGSHVEFGENSETISTLGREMDINEVIDLDYDEFIDDVNEKLSGTGIQPILLFETSRGCWWGAKAHCVFCGLNSNSMTYRAMKPETAVEVLSTFFQRYGDRVTQYSSVDNIMPKHYLGSVFPKLKIPENFSLFYEVKADLKPEELGIMAKTRINTIQPGIESLHTPTLKLMKKGATGVGNVYFLKHADKNKIHSFWNLLVGFPGGKKDAYPRYVNDIDGLFHLTPPKDIYIIRFDRYSPYHMNPEEYGLSLRPISFYNFLYPDYGFDSLMKLAYFFEDNNEQPEYSQHVQKWYSKLSKAISNWEIRNSGADNLEPATLCFGLEENTIRDTRSGKLIIHTLTNQQRKILGCLEQPRNINKMLNMLNPVSKRIAMDDIDFIIDKKLVFHENRSSFVSVVLEAAQVGENEIRNATFEKILR